MVSSEELERMWNADIRAEFARLRAESLNIPCRYCKAVPGEVCINLENQGQLEKMPAHMWRLQEIAVS